MALPWNTLDSHDRATFNATVAFLRTRLSEYDTLDWVLRLKPNQKVERIAILYLLREPQGTQLTEPWASAWGLIEDSWSEIMVKENQAIAISRIQARLRAGVRNGAVVSSIVNLVAPHLEVQAIIPQQHAAAKRPCHPVTFHDLLRPRLTSGGLIDLNNLELAQVEEVPFLVTLANALDAAVIHGLDIGKRIGWDETSGLLQLGKLYQVKDTRSDDEDDINTDRDARNHGIAPSVKFLHAVVLLIARLEMRAAVPFMHRWRNMDSPVHIRLWSEVTLNRLLVSSEQVSTFLLGLNDRQFWDLKEFPEIAELRAQRFHEMDLETQKAITGRLREGPPNTYWSKWKYLEDVEKTWQFWAVRELKRIMLADGILPGDMQSWVDERVAQFPELKRMTVDEGIVLATSQGGYRPYNPDERYDMLHGLKRLQALEEALAHKTGWLDNPANRAIDWLQQADKPLLVLSDLESVERGGDAFPLVWNRFCWTHNMALQEIEVKSQDEHQLVVERVLQLLVMLSDETLTSAIEGVCQWLLDRKKQVVTSQIGLQVCLRIWPFAVAATNAIRQSLHITTLVNRRFSHSNLEEMAEPDTLNNAAGKLVNVFVCSCSSLKNIRDLFQTGTMAQQMRDTIIASTGRSGLIARYRLIEDLGYFHAVDPDWTKTHLIGPLRENNDESLVLWRAVALQTKFTDVLRIIGDIMIERASDQRLGRETRQMLVFSIVVEVLHALSESREPAVGTTTVQQMLRKVESDGRVDAAEAIVWYVKNASGEGNAPAHALFEDAVAPFINDVWPKELALVVPGTAYEFAALPVAAGEAFEDAVESIERFLMPFQCESLSHYGFDVRDANDGTFLIINDESKARAFLLLLELTVDISENAIIPHGLPDALHHIRSVSPDIANENAFRRLSAVTRR